MRIRLWYRGFEVTIEGDPDAATRALDVVVSLLSDFKPPEVTS